MTGGSPSVNRPRPFTHARGKTVTADTHEGQNRRDSVLGRYRLVLGPTPSWLDYPSDRTSVNLLACGRPGQHPPLVAGRPIAASHAAPLVAYASVHPDGGRIPPDSDGVRQVRLGRSHGGGALLVHALLVHIWLLWVPHGAYGTQRVEDCRGQLPPPHPANVGRRPWARMPTPHGREGRLHPGGRGADPQHRQFSLNIRP